MNRASWVMASLLIVSRCMPLHAQTLTEKQFLDSVLATHPAVEAAEAKKAAAAGGRRQAGIVSNPVLSWDREEPDPALRQDTWRLDWRLPFDGRKHRKAAWDAELAAANADLQNTQLGIRLKMRSLYAGWYIAVEREKVLQAHFDGASRLARWLSARAEEGEAAGVEARRLDMEVEVFERELVAARAFAGAEQAAAANWSALVTDDVRPQRPILPFPPSAIDVGNRADLRAITHRVDKSEAEHRIRKRVFEPPAISVGWTELGEGGLTFDGPVFGIAWPVPVFDRNQGNDEAAAAETSHMRSVLELETRQAEERAQAALAAYADLYSIAVRRDAGSETIDVAVAVFAAFEAGEAGLTDVLDTLRASVGVQMARLDSLDLALATERALEAAIGGPVLPGGSS